NAGVTEYTVDTSSGEIVYKGGFGTWQKAKRASTPVKVNEQASKEAFETVLQRRMRKEMTYTEFLRQIAAAGIAYYRVDMASRSVTYYDLHSRAIHVQQVPEIK